LLFRSVDKNHRKEALKFCDVIWRRVDPVSDSRIAVGNGIECKMAGHSGNERREGASGDPCCDEHSDRDVDGGEQGRVSRSIQT